MTHRERMAVRRANQHARTPGFTPVPNRRIDKAVTIAQASIMFAAAQRGTPLNPVDARQAAWREVARSLPRPAMVFDWRNGLPTKNDNPEYRK